MTWVEPFATDTTLLMLRQGGHSAAAHDGKGPDQLSDPSDSELGRRAQAAKAALGRRVFVLGHHYQRDEVIQFADVTGDSLKLAQQAAARPEAEWIVCCGVHFMAESVDILTSDQQRVILPDLAAGCAMADMAARSQVETVWKTLAQVGLAETTVPVTYLNSTADIKGFVGRHQGVVCTSSNARQVLDWAFDRGERVLFLPDQHLGRNTAVLELGFDPADCVEWDPAQPAGGFAREQLRAAKMILWQGHCPVHDRFGLDCVQEIRQRVPGVNVLVHPECRHEVAAAADQVGSTEKIIKTVAAAPPGSAWAIGTELSLVRRLARSYPDRRIIFLDRTVCYCSTMNRIGLPQLVWVLEELMAGRVVNQITVPPDTAHHARVALDRMLALT